MPELISIKHGRGHPKNFTNLYKMKNVKFEWNLYHGAPKWKSGIEI